MAIINFKKSCCCSGKIQLDISGGYILFGPNTLNAPSITPNVSSIGQPILFLQRAAMLALQALYYL